MEKGVTFVVFPFYNKGLKHEKSNKISIKVMDISMKKSILALIFSGSMFAHSTSKDLAGQNNEQELNTVRQEINNWISEVNEDSHKLSLLQAQEQKLRLFYHNQEYLSEEGLKRLSDSLDTWEVQADTAIRVKTKAYNQAVSDFETQQREHQALVAESRQQIQQEEQRLALLREEINTLVTQYNQDRESVCETEQCASMLKQQQALIKEKKESYEAQILLLPARWALFNQGVNEGTKQQESEKARLYAKKQELETFKQNLLQEWEQKKQAYEESVQMRQATAREEWTAVQEQLSQFQQQITMDYGEDFPFFLEKVNDWSKAVALDMSHFENLSAETTDKTVSRISDRASRPAMQALCAYTELYPLAEKAKNLCESIKKWHKELGVRVL